MSLAVVIANKKRILNVSGYLLAVGCVLGEADPAMEFSVHHVC